MNKAKYKAKFADQLMSNQVMIPQVFTAGYDVIDEICNDYESRTCENCKHYEERIQGMGECNKIIYQGFSVGLVYGYDNMFLPKDFGCNKFERIQDGQ